jgi:hypothetical protein
LATGIGAVESAAAAAGAVPCEGIDGLAWGYRFSKTGIAEPLQGPALREALEKQEVWLWLNFDLADEGASATIAALPHLPKGALAMLRSADDRQQIDGFGQAIAGVWRTTNAAIRRTKSTSCVGTSR